MFIATYVGLWRALFCPHFHCYAPGEGGRAYLGGFDILPLFHVKFPTQGATGGVKYPFPGGKLQ